MPLIANWFVGGSIAVSIIVSGYRYAATRRLRSLLLRIGGSLLMCLILYDVFDFPRSAPTKGPSEWNDFYPIIGLYCAMALGMLAQYAYEYFSQPPTNRRRAFDWANFIAPIFLSPIVFIPLFETLKSAPQIHATMMSLLVAFENGFFFKNFVDHRERVKSSVRCIYPFILLLAFAPSANGSECEYIQGVTCVKSPGYPQMIHYSRTRPDSRSLWKKVFNVDTPPFNRSVALLVGMGNYKHLTKLPFVYNDLRDLRDYLLNDEQFNDVYVIQDRDIDANSLRGLIVNTFSHDLLGSEDRFLFYYSGHGSPEADGNGHILLWGADSRSYDPVWDLPVSEIKLWSTRLPAKHVLFLLDGCGLGLGLPAKAASVDQLSMIGKNGSRTVLAATRGGENSYGTIDGKHSLFTSELIKVLRSGDADPHGYGFVTIDEVSSILQTDLARDLRGSLNAEGFNPVTPESLDINHNGQFIFLTGSGKHEMDSPHDRGENDGTFKPKGDNASTVPLTKSLPVDSSISGPGVRRPLIPDEAARQEPTLKGRLTADLRDVSQVDDAGFSPDGTQIVTVNRAGVSVWDATTFRLLYSIKISSAESCGVYSPDSLRLLTCSDGDVSIWSAKTGQLLNKLKIQHKASYLSASFSPDGAHVLIHIVDLQDNPQDKFAMWGGFSPFTEFTLPPKGSNGGQIHSMSFTKDGSRLVSVASEKEASNNEAAIWDSKTGQLLHAFPIPKKDDIYFLTSGTKAVSVGSSGFHILDYSSNQILATVATCPSIVGSRSVDDKSMVVLCGNSAQIWDIGGGRIIATVAHSSYIRSAVFSPDSERLITASFDLTARIWEARTGKLLATLAHNSEVYTATFSPDGLRVLTTGPDNVAHVFELSPPE